MLSAAQGYDRLQVRGSDVTTSSATFSTVMLLSFHDVTNPATMTSLPFYCDVTNPATMTSLPFYCDVTNPATMTSLPFYYDVTNPANVTSLQ